MGIILFSFFILKNGIQIFQYNGNKIQFFYEAPYYFKIDEKEPFDLGITYSIYKNPEELKNNLNSLKAKYIKNIRKYESDMINLITGYYLPDTLKYSSIKVFVPENDVEIVLTLLNSIDFSGFMTPYDIHIETIQGFFSISENPKYYVNIPPDVRSKDYVSFRIFMKYLENKGVKVLYSKFGKCIPFFINIKDKYEAINLFKENIDNKELEKAREDFFKDYTEMKEDEVLMNLFLSISGLNRWNFLTEWEEKIKKVKVEDIIILKFRFSTGGLLWGQS